MNSIADALLCDLSRRLEQLRKSLPEGPLLQANVNALAAKTARSSPLKGKRA